MKKKRFVLVLSSIIIASFAFACAPKAPEDHFIEVVDTLFSKFDTTKDCDVLAKDIESYCQSVCVDLAASHDWKNVSNFEDAERGRKVEKTVEELKGKYKHINQSACMDDLDVRYALSWCSRQSPYLAGISTSIETKADLANADLAETQLKSFRNSVQAYKLYYKKLPEKLDDLINTPDKHKILEEIPQDPWGKSYSYKKTGNSIKLSSNGSDGLANTKDDIVVMID